MALKPYVPVRCAKEYKTPINLIPGMLMVNILMSIKGIIHPKFKIMSHLNFYIFKQCHNVSERLGTILYFCPEKKEQKKQCEHNSFSVFFFR